jgi:hypothetical protein
MYRLLMFFVFSFFLFISCSDQNENSTEKTKFELLQYKWKVATMEIDGTSFPTNSGNVDKIRITFNNTNYTYVYPAPPTAPAEQQGTMLTLTGPWKFNANETSIILDRSSISEPDFEWEILQLSTGIFKARYKALNPFNPDVEANYDFGYTIEL